jgi:hypothetical protein
MKKKQLKTIRLVSNFIPLNVVNWKDGAVLLGDGQIGIQNIENGGNISAYKAFFMKTERGILPPKIKNKHVLRKLLWGQKWMAAHVKMWKEGISEGIFLDSELKPSGRKLL